MLEGEVKIVRMEGGTAVKLKDAVPNLTNADMSKRSAEAKKADAAPPKPGDAPPKPDAVNLDNYDMVSFSGMLFSQSSGDRQTDSHLQMLRILGPAPNVNLFSSLTARVNDQP